MPEGFYIGFDFGYKRIGVAVGQRLTGKASPLSTLKADNGIPDWQKVDSLIQYWRPQALIVGLPTKADNTKLYTTKASKIFGNQLSQRFDLPVYFEDERLSTKEARAMIFEAGGYKKLKKTEIDSVAACVILEQWLQNQPSHSQI